MWGWTERLANRVSCGVRSRARRSTKPRYPMGQTWKYGYLWWMGEYRYGGRTLPYYFAAGNGGQISVAIPALDLVVAAFGGNYADRSAQTTSRELIPQYVLPAVDVGK